MSQAWLSTYLPHNMQKVNRVTFGLMTQSEVETLYAAEEAKARSRLQAEREKAKQKGDKGGGEGKAPGKPDLRSRTKLAIPFVGKDMPSPAAEFALPDIVIGLTIFAYELQGLRMIDMVRTCAHAHAYARLARDGLGPPPSAWRGSCSCSRPRRLRGCPAASRPTRARSVFCVALAFDV